VILVDSSAAQIVDYCFWMNLQAHYDLKMAQQSLGPAEAKPIKARRAA